MASQPGRGATFAFFLGAAFAFFLGAAAFFFAAVAFFFLAAFLVVFLRTGFFLAAAFLALTAAFFAAAFSTIAAAFAGINLFRQNISNRPPSRSPLYLLQNRNRPPYSYVTQRHDTVQ